MTAVLEWLKKHAKTIGFTFVIVLVLIVGMVFEGRLWYCACGYVKLWHSEVNSFGNSQHIFDPYAFTHVLHGLFLFFIARGLHRKGTVAQWFLIALALETGWELVENSNFIINRYRATTISFDYFGDSIINSVGDLFAAGIGFWIAAKFSWKWVVFIFIALEILLLFFIRDNLTINIIQLIYPIDAIKEWQYDAGAPRPIAQ